MHAARTSHIDTRQTAVSINVKLDIPFIGKNEDYFG